MDRRNLYVPQKMEILKTDNGAELLPLVDAEGRVVGSATRAKCHDGSMLLHPVVHLHVINSRGELYLQHRPAWKQIQPDRWDTAVGGHIDWGEECEQALQREAHEELGIDDFAAKHICTYEFRSSCEHELINVYICRYDGEIRPSDELADGRFWSREEIEQNLGRGVFTPNFESEAERIRLLEMLR